MARGGAEVAEKDQFCAPLARINLFSAISAPARYPSVLQSSSVHCSLDCGLDFLSALPRPESEGLVMK
jgi:hypothetical protein